MVWSDLTVAVEPEGEWCSRLRCCSGWRLQADSAVSGTADRATSFPLVVPDPACQVSDPEKSIGRASARITKNRRFSATRIFQNHKPNTRITRGVTFLSHKVLFRSLNRVHLWFNHRFSSYVTAAIEHDLDRVVGERSLLTAKGSGGVNSGQGGISRSPGQGRRQ